MFTRSQAELGIGGLGSSSRWSALLLGTAVMARRTHPIILAEIMPQPWPRRSKNGFEDLSPEFNPKSFLFCRRIVSQGSQ